MFAADDSSDGALPASVDTHVATVALPIKLNAAELLFGGTRDKLTLADAERDGEPELDTAPERDADGEDDEGTRDKLAATDDEYDGEPELEPALVRDADATGDGDARDQLAVADAELDGEAESNAVEFAEKARPAQIKNTAVSMAARISAERKETRQATAWAM
jgi:hypothetical protein